MSSIGTTSAWFKSSFSKEAANCVEVRITGKSVLVRDSKYLRDPANDPAHQPVIDVPSARWEAFLASVVEYGQSTDPELPNVVSTASGVEVTAGDTTLRFTVDEWVAFVAGVAVGEFAAA